MTTYCLLSPLRGQLAGRCCSNPTQAHSALPRLHGQPSNSSSLQHQDPQPNWAVPGSPSLGPPQLPWESLNKRMPAQMTSGGGPHHLQSPCRGPGTEEGRLDPHGPQGSSPFLLTRGARPQGLPLTAITLEWVQLLRFFFKKKKGSKYFLPDPRN